MQIWTMVNPGPANEDISGAKSWVTFSLTWAYMLSQQLWVVFLLVLYCSRLGGMKLGKEGDDPEYPAASWFMMMFSAGAPRNCAPFSNRHPESTPVMCHTDVSY